MATATSTDVHPVYVQQSFLWDDQNPANSGQGSAIVLENELASQSGGSVVGERVAAPVRPSIRRPLTVPSVKKSSSVRRGRCEHVGGILASVLEKYGIGIDQLIAEIDGK